MTLDSYHAFAGVYDRLMADVPYEKWAARLDRDICEYGISSKIHQAGEQGERIGSEDEPVTEDPGGQGERESMLLESERNLVCDLGCGTGIITRKLFDMGYDAFGVDVSADMLSEAAMKDEGRGIMYLNQDITELDLYSTIGTAVCICDSLNYLLSDDELEKAFKGVSNFLYPGGIFIFDCNTRYKYKEAIGDTTIAEDDGDVSFIWDNFYDETENVNECDLTLFIRRDDGLYERAEETHLQRGIDVSDITQLSEKSGLEIVFIKDSDTEENISETTERIYACLKKNCK